MANGTVLTLVTTPSPVAAVSSAVTSKFSPRVKAAIALPIIMVVVVGIMYALNRFSPAGDVAPGFVKIAFGASALTFVFTVIPAIAIGAYVSQKGGSTQLTQAAIGLGGIAGVTLLVTGGLGVRYGKGLFTSTVNSIPATVPIGGFGILGLLMTIGGVVLLGYWGAKKNKINNPNNYRNAGIAMLTIGVAIMAGSGILFKRGQTPVGNGQPAEAVTTETETIEIPGNGIAAPAAEVPAGNGNRPAAPPGP